MAGSNQWPEYNPLGDAATGTTGSFTPASQANAATQQPASTGNPFADVLNHVAAFNNLVASPMSKARGVQPGGPSYSAPPSYPGASMPPSWAEPPSAPPAFGPSDGFSNPPGWGPTMPPSAPWVPADPSAPPQFVPGPVGPQPPQGGPTLWDTMPRGAPPPPVYDPVSGLWSQAQSGGSGPIDKASDGDLTTNPNPSGGGPIPVAGGPNPIPVPVTTKPTPKASITDPPVDTNVPMPPSTLEPPPNTNVPMPPAGSGGTVDLNGDTRGTPPPAPPVMPSLAGQQNGQPLAPGPTGENASDLAMRWKQAVIANGDTDGISQYITPFSIDFYRNNNPNGLDPTAWFKDPANIAALNKATGMPTGPAGGPAPATAPVPNVPAPNGAPPELNTNVPMPPSPTGGTPPPGTNVPMPPAGGGTPPPTAGTPTSQGTPPTPNAPGTTGPSANIQNIVDTISKNFTAKQPGIESLLDPAYARQRQNLADDMRAQAAATGGLQSGGFGENLATAESNLSGQQSADLASHLSQQYLAEMQQNTAIAGLATNAGMQQFTAEMDDSFKRDQLTSQDSLAKWLDSADNTLKKYGIDKNDVLQRYITLTQSGDSRYAADQGVSAAAMHAAAANAAANAAAAASERNAQLQYQLGVQGLGVTRENNIGNFILGLLGVNNANINTANGILSGIPTGNVVVKP